MANLDPTSSTFWRDLYNQFKVAVATRETDSFFVQEHEAFSKVRTVYQRLGSVSNFLTYLKEEARKEALGVTVETDGIALFTFGGSNAQF